MRGAVIAVAATPGGSQIVAGSVGRYLRSFTPSGQELLPKKECDNEVWSLSIDSAGRFIAAGSASKKA